MKLSIICLCYNQENSIIKLIKSIKYSNINYEIIVIDDNSTDNSINLIQKLNLKNIIIIKNKTNLNNQSYSRNIGIKKSTGDYILFMDGDDYYNSYELKKLFNYICNNKPQNIISLNTLHIGKNIQYYTKLDFNQNEIFHSVTMFCIKKNFLIQNKLFWEEKKYYVDGEDFYYTFLVLGINPIIEYYDEFISIVIKNINSNTNNKYKKETYIKYLQSMCNDTILYLYNKNNINLIKYVNEYEKNEIQRYLEVQYENNHDL